jgi:O-methyltransferase
VIERTLLRPEQFDALAHLWVKTRNLPGDIAEVGVYQGGVSKWLAQLAPDKRVYACDTFYGLPGCNVNYDIDKHRPGDFYATFNEVFEYLDLPNIHIVDGIFPHCATSVMTSSKFSFVHIDVDLYLSTLDAIDFFWPRMVPGGIILSDDYDWPECPGVRKAFEEMFTQGQICDTGVNSCYVVKS